MALLEENGTKPIIEVRDHTTTTALNELHHHHPHHQHYPPSPSTLLLLPSNGPSIGHPALLHHAYRSRWFRRPFSPRTSSSSPVAAVGSTPPLPGRLVAVVVSAMSSSIPDNILEAFASNATGIPPDITPEYLAESRDGPAYAGIIFVGVLTLIVLTLRCYARIFIIRSFGIDDYLAVVTMVTFLAFIGLCIWLIKLGSGRHIEYIEYVLDSPTTSRTEVVDFAAHIIYTTSLFICRLSGLFFYRRLCHGSPRLMLLTTCAGIFVVAGYLPQLFLLIFHCSPVTGLWPYAWQVPEVNDYTCLQWGVVYVVNSSVSLLCDLVMLTIPALLIMTLQVDTRSKINLSLILFPGVIVIGVSCARLYLVVQGQWQPDQAWWYNPQLVIECTEIGGTLIALSVPALKPLVVQWSVELSTYGHSRRTGASASGVSSDPGGSHHYRSHGSGITGKAKAILLSGSHRSHADVERSTSEDHLAEKSVDADDAGIHKTVSIQMDVWDGKRSV